MTPFTQPHPLSSPLTLYVYGGEGVESLATGIHAAAWVVIQFGNHSEVKQGQGHVRKSSVAPAIPAPI